MEDVASAPGVFNGSGASGVSQADAAVMEGWTINSKEQRDALIAHIDKCLEKDEFVRFVVHRPETRTQKQNRALWVACEMLATELNDAGFDIRTFPWKEGVDLPWDKDQVKKRLFDPIMKAMTEKESSTRLNKKEVGDIWEVMMRHVSQTVGVSLPFPSWNQLYASSSAPQKTK